jgi:hypothetical protein
MLNTGTGGDEVTVKLIDGQDGAFALNTEAGDDIVDGLASTLPLIVFGGEGDDDITGGFGADTLFGDIGRVDYLNEFGEIVTRLGHSVPQSPVNPPVAFEVASATDDTITVGTANLTVNALAGFTIQVVAPDGAAQLRTIVSNTTSVITLDDNESWTTPPNNTLFYRILFDADNVAIAGVDRATLTDPLGNFETEYGGMVGLVVQVISPAGHVQFRQIIAKPRPSSPSTTLGMTCRSSTRFFRRATSSIGLLLIPKIRPTASSAARVWSGRSRMIPAATTPSMPAAASTSSSAAPVTTRCSMVAPTPTMCLATMHVSITCRSRATMV